MYVYVCMYVCNTLADSLSQLQIQTFKQLHPVTWTHPQRRYLCISSHTIGIDCIYTYQIVSAAFINSHFQASLEVVSTV